MMFLSSKYSPLRIAIMESKFIFQSKKDFIESTRKIYQQMLATLDDRLFGYGIARSVKLSREIDFLSSEV